MTSLDKLDGLDGLDGHDLRAAAAAVEVTGAETAGTEVTGVEAVGAASDGDEAQAAAGGAPAAPDDASDAVPAEHPAVRGRLTRLPRSIRVRRSARMPRRTVLWAVAWTAAAVLAAVAGWSYASVRGDDALHYGKQRDAVLTAGRQDIAQLTTADAGHAERDLGRWLAVTTGPLHDRLAGTHAADAATLKASGASATGTVTDAAVTELDPRAGTAKVIATVQVSLRPSSGAATTDRKRFEADLARDGGTWKLAALTAVPLGSS